MREYDTRDNGGGFAALEAGFRRVVVLMTPFPPFGGGEVTVQGAKVPKSQTTSVKTLKMGGVAAEVVCVLGTTVHGAACSSHANR